MSCLGFVVYQTKDDKIDFAKILLLLAVISWSLSIYFGISFIKKQQHGLHLNYMIYENQRNKFEDSKNNIEKIKIVDSIFKEKINSVSDKSKRQYKYQLNTFFIGVVLYILWHILKMYLNTINSPC